MVLLNVADILEELLIGLRHLPDLLVQGHFRQQLLDLTVKGSERLDRGGYPALRCQQNRHREYAGEA